METVEQLLDIPVTKKETVHLLFNLQVASGDCDTICKTYGITPDVLEDVYREKLLIPGMNVSMAWTVMQHVVDAIVVNDVSESIKQAVINAMKLTTV